MHRLGWEAKLRPDATFEVTAPDGATGSPTRRERPPGRVEAAPGSLVFSAITRFPYGVLNRPPVERDDLSGLREMRSLVVDKITTVPRSKIGDHVGRLGDDDLLRLRRAILGFSSVWRGDGRRHSPRPVAGQ